MVDPILRAAATSCGVSRCLINKLGEGVVSDDRLRLVCPKCDYAMATVPADRRPSEPLICSNCGAKVYPQTPLARLSGWFRRLLGGK